jgi:hypothetical protein
MIISADKAADLRLGYLQVIQSIITRLSGYSASLKNYCLTLVTAICGFGVTIQRPGAIWLAALPIILFAILDARYLCLERSAIAAYDEVREGDWSAIPSFAISLRPPDSYCRALLSWSVAGFYVSVLAGVAAVALIFGYALGRAF